MSKFIQEREFLETKIGGKNPFFLIAGPCVIESRELLDRVASEMVDLCKSLGIYFIFKSSFDKANRSSKSSFRGVGIEEGLRSLDFIKNKYNIPVLTDIHETYQVDILKPVIDVFQIPAFLCRQTDLIEKAAESGRWVNVKKGQFLAPNDCRHIVGKIKETGSEKYLITERGTSFGYNNLVFDTRSIPILHSMNIPIVYDGTHSAQLPGAAGDITGGQREFIPDLMKAAVSLGVEGLFMEVHPDPPAAKSDSTTQYYLSKAGKLLEQLKKLDSFVKEHSIGFEED
jgi:2-dehydro-3-deoxyphosphooctonate aldolase (KDO 8-P synthase)